MTFSSTKKFFKIISRKNLFKFLFIFQPTAAEEQAIGKIDDLLESFMGIRDGDLGKMANQTRISNYQNLSKVAEKFDIFMVFAVCKANIY